MENLSSALWAHLLLQHGVVVGLPVATLWWAWAWWRRPAAGPLAPIQLPKRPLALLAGIALLGLVVAQTGEAAHRVVGPTLDDASHHLMHEHEEAGEALRLGFVAILLFAAALWVAAKRLANAFTLILGWGLVAVTVATLVYTVQVAHMGMTIRHPGLRLEQPAP